MSEKTETRRVVIVGLGLIGGSIGLRLKAAELPGLEIVGTDADRSNERAAKTNPSSCRWVTAPVTGATWPSVCCIRIPQWRS